MHPCAVTEALYRPTAHRGSRGIALHFRDHGTGKWWGVSLTPRPLFTPGKAPVPIVQETVWAPGPVWTGAENLAPTGIRSPGRPARIQSLYRLRYPAYKFNMPGTNLSPSDQKLSKFCPAAVLLFYEGCSESNSPHFFSHSGIKIAMWKLRDNNTEVYCANVCKYTVVRQIAPL